MSFPIPHSLLPTPHSSLRGQPGYSGHCFRKFDALHRVVGAEDSTVGGGILTLDVEEPTRPSNPSGTVPENLRSGSLT
jgi:hypothetical protein